MDPDVLDKIDEVYGGGSATKITDITDVSPQQQLMADYMVGLWKSVSPASTDDDLALLGDYFKLALHEEIARDSLKFVAKRIAESPYFQFIVQNFKVSGQEQTVRTPLLGMLNLAPDPTPEELRCGIDPGLLGIDKAKKEMKEEIKKNEIVISQEELDEALLKAEAGYPNDSFKKQLKFEGMTRKEWEYTIENNLLIKKLISILVNSKVSVSDGEMRRYFDANESKFHKLEQVRALHIMVETEEEIRLIQKELQSKQKDFSELAKEFSLGPEGTLGGDLGYLRPVRCLKSLIMFSSLKLMVSVTSFALLMVFICLRSLIKLKNGK